jgi:hypothetical protein
MDPRHIKNSQAEEDPDQPMTPGGDAGGFNMSQFDNDEHSLPKGKSY